MFQRGRYWGVQRRDFGGKTFVVKFVFATSFSASWIKEEEAGLRKKHLWFSERKDNKSVVVS